MCDNPHRTVQNSPIPSPDPACGTAQVAVPNSLTGTTRDLFPHVYAQLRDLAHAKFARERPGLTLQTTALVHEVFLRLSSDPQVTWENPRHFFAAAAQAMRRILIERARRYASPKHGGHHPRQHPDSLDLFAQPESPDPHALLSLSDAIDELNAFDPQLAEVVMLRYFAGLSFEEVAQTLDRSLRAVKYDWAAARAWLLRRLSD